MKDILGTLLSGMCILHCLFGASLLALGGTGLMSVALHPSDIHLMIVIPVFVLAAFSFPNAKKRHGKDGPIKMASFGLFMLALALLMEVIWHLHLLETILTVIGGGTLMYAHIQNRKHLNVHLSVA